MRQSENANAVLSGNVSFRSSWGQGPHCNHHGSFFTELVVIFQAHVFLCICAQCRRESGGSGEIILKTVSL